MRIYIHRQILGRGENMDKNPSKVHPFPGILLPIRRWVTGQTKILKVLEENPLGIWSSTIPTTILSTWYAYAILEFLSILDYPAGLIQPW